MDKDKDKEKKSTRHPNAPSESQPLSTADMEELYRRLQPEMRRPKPGADAIAAALEAAQRLAAETDAEDAASDLAQDLVSDSGAVICAVCGYHNRGANKFCGMCGLPVAAPSAPAMPPAPEPERPPSRAMEPIPNPFAGLVPETRPAANRGSALETHHYHHHYHHHYFPGGSEGTDAQGMGAQNMGWQNMNGQGMSPRSPDAMRDPDKMRPTAALRGDMSRAEAAVRRITQEWVLACNTKHLDDLLDLYVADALVLRSNYPPVRGAAAVREFFFGALDAGLGEVEMEPLRVDIAGDMAYEAGRCKALVPGATGKRREERGKYLWVCARQSNGEWKLAADCWSSDLSFTTMESDVPAGTGVKTSQPRKP
ncbi:MAG TPA: nuclear transport factor 2 family protein [Candidatus Sulfotelmatobacter sp.]|nr:nuclear transport factor 2 family protein [Candidatus Sulfotelmatobacter sp.]